MTTTQTQTYTYTHSVTYVTDKVMRTLKEIIHGSGLSPAKLTDDWDSTERGIKAWIASGHLRQVILEVHKPLSRNLIHRWDITIDYKSVGDNDFWFDPDDIRYNIQKAGFFPAECEYSIVVINAPGRPDVSGWGPCQLRPTNGLVRQSVGTLINSNGISANAGYWRK